MSGHQPAQQLLACPALTCRALTCVPPACLHQRAASPARSMERMSIPKGELLPRFVCWCWVALPGPCQCRPAAKQGLLLPAAVPPTLPPCSGEYVEGGDQVFKASAGEGGEGGEDDVAARSEQSDHRFDDEYR